MISPNQKIAVGVFEQMPQAEQAIAELWQAGFAHDRIDMITRSEGRGPATPRFEWQKDATTGAVAGGAAGAAAGAMAGALAMVLLPGLGFVLGGGLLAGALGGAAFGAAGGTFAGPFIALHMTPDEAEYYAKEVDEGRTVVLVQEEQRFAEAQAILRRHGARLSTPVAEAAASV